MNVTVIIPTHNPRPHILRRTLGALSQQTLPREAWELLVVDNASNTPVEKDLLRWHPSSRVVREETLGLTHARLRGIAESVHGILVWVDDDNVLAPDYLEQALRAFAADDTLGAAGGISVPEFEQSPPDWYELGVAPLGCRDHGPNDIRMRWQADRPEYPRGAPIGAGMVTRRAAIQVWADAVRSDSARLALGRKGTALSSGEDNDINLTLLRAGWDLAYIPALKLTHIIPPGRLTLEYQKRMSRTSFRDFVRVLDMHGIRPWSAIPAWSIPMRLAKAWVTHRAWSSPTQMIRWYGAWGQTEGRAALRPRVAD